MVQHDHFIDFESRDRIFVLLHVISFVSPPRTQGTGEECFVLKGKSFLLKIILFALKIKHLMLYLYLQLEGKMIYSSNLIKKFSQKYIIVNQKQYLLSELEYNFEIGTAYILIIAYILIFQIVTISDKILEFLQPRQFKQRYNMHTFI